MITFKPPPPVNWPSTLRELKSARPCLTLRRVAAIVGVGKSSLIALSKGQTKNPTYRVGAAVLALHKSVVSSDD